MDIHWEFGAQSFHVRNPEIRIGFNLAPNFWSCLTTYFCSYLAFILLSSEAGRAGLGLIVCWVRIAFAALAEDLSDFWSRVVRPRVPIL